MFTLYFVTCLMGASNCATTPYDSYKTEKECIEAGNGYVHRSTEPYATFTDGTVIKYNGTKALFFDKDRGILVRFDCHKEK